MNARGSTEVIVATIGLSMGALSQNLFTMIVAMAVITTMAMPPTLRWALARLPMRKEEKQRLEREEMEATGFVPKLERLLLAVDESANGKFASRIAGLHRRHHAHADHRHAHQDRQQDRQGRRRSRKGEGQAAPPRRSRNSPKADERARADRRTKRPTPSSTSPPSWRQSPKPDVVAEEAEKGYDLLIIGLEKTVARGNEFHEDVTNLAAGLRRPAGGRRRARRAARASAARQARASWCRSTAPKCRAAPPKSPSPWRAPARRRSPRSTSRRGGTARSARGNTRKPSSRTSSNSPTATNLSCAPRCAPMSPPTKRS